MTEPVAQKTDCYTGTLPCGCMVAVVMDDPKFKDDTADKIAEFVRSGYRVEPAVLDNIRSRLRRCKCRKAKRP